MINYLVISFYVWPFCFTQVLSSFRFSNAAFGGQRTKLTVFCRRFRSDRDHMAATLLVLILFVFLFLSH